MAQYDPELRGTPCPNGVRLLLRHGRWDEAYQLTSSMPSLATTSRWRYWQARSLQLANPKASRPSPVQPLAKERDFYGFLAADRTRRPAQPQPPSRCPSIRVMQTRCATRQASVAP